MGKIILGETELTQASEVSALNERVSTIEGITPLGKTINTTWANLKSLRNNSQLVPGQWYRITDYATTTTQTDTQSAGHAFDVIVRADGVNVLNENAYAAKHAGDTYFTNAGARLEAWRLLYSLDNIYWSQVPISEHIVLNMYQTFIPAYYDGTYDINGTTYYHWKAASRLGPDEYAYTISKTVGAIVYYYYMGTLGQLSTIYSYNEAVDTEGKGIITWMKDEWDNECPYDFKNIQFKVGAKSQAGTVADVFYYTFSVATGTNDATVTDHSLNGSKCYGNKFGKYIKGSIQTLNANVFRNISVTLGCYSNIFGNECYNNTFGKSCFSNTFGNGCYSNTFGNECYHNTFGNSCYSNTFYDSCHSNIFGNSCYSNTFRNNCIYNTFGDGCYNNKLSISYSQNNIFENGNHHITLTSTQTTSSSSKLCNIKICQGVNNTTTTKTISHNTVNDTFQTEYKAANSQIITV